MTHMPSNAVLDTHHIVPQKLQAQSAELEQNENSCPCDGDHGQTELLDIDTVVARAMSDVQPVKNLKRIRLRDAVGRVLAKDVFAPRSMPFFDNSAMDGFAVNTADFACHGPTTLPMVGEAAAGSNCSAALSRGTCMPIYTGAPIPAGSDAVIPVELAEDLGESARFRSAPKSGAHIRREGSDIERNSLLVKAGIRIAARHVGLLAANGIDALDVYQRPRVAIVSTGDELQEPGCALSRGQLFDCNRPMLIAALQKAGCEARDFGIVADDRHRTTKLFRELAGEFELIVSSGSVSVGNRDFLKHAFADAGGAIKAWKAAVKPGKPVMIGQIAQTAFLGLPGNPYAAWIGFQLFGRPMVDVLAGTMPTPMTQIPATAGAVFPHKKGRREYVPVSHASATDRDAIGSVSRIGHGGSASMYTACLADGLAVIPADTGNLEVGDRVTFLPFQREFA